MAFTAEIYNMLDHALRLLRTKPFDHVLALRAEFLVNPHIVPHFSRPQADFAKLEVPFASRLGGAECKSA